MTNSVESSLTQGLLTGYAGGEIKDIERASFKGKSSHVETPDFIYHDEWFSMDQSGGGQELILVNDQKFTRLYAGGTPNPEVLKNLGISAKDVGKYLKSKITKLKDQTRLFQDCIPDPDDNWQYSYIIKEQFPQIQTITSLESITYKSNIVHIHAFILSPIR